MNPKIHKQCQIGNLNYGADCSRTIATQSNTQKYGVRKNEIVGIFVFDML